MKQLQKATQHNCKYLVKVDRFQATDKWLEDNNYGTIVWLYVAG